MPLLGGAVFHGLCMRQGWLAFLARPIDAGRCLRGRRWFGHSKTWRGPIAVSAGAAAAYALERALLQQIDALGELSFVAPARLPGVWFGALLGAAAELSELPNSFVKRRLDIAPGATARGPLAVVFYARGTSSTCCWASGWLARSTCP